jgi:hypothetical protein
VGPRELAFIAALAPVMPRGSAIVVAVVSRLVLTAADLIWAAAAFVLGRLDRRREHALLPGAADGAAHAEPGAADREVAGRPGARDEDSIVS